MATQDMIDNINYATQSNLAEAEDMLKGAEEVINESSAKLIALGNGDTIPPDAASFVYQQADGTYVLNGIPQSSWRYAHEAHTPTIHNSLDDVRRTLERYRDEATNEGNIFNSQRQSYIQQLQNPPQQSGRVQTILYSNPEKIGSGSAKHFNEPDALGHSRIMVRADQPENMYFLETQSDWQQNPDINYDFEWANDYETRLKGFEADISGIENNIAQHKEILNDPDNILDKNTIKARIDMYEKELANIKQDFKNYKRNASPGTQKQFLREKTQERLIQEEFITAAAEGKDYVLFPTRETAVKIQNYEWMKGPLQNFIQSADSMYNTYANSIKQYYLPNLDPATLKSIDDIKEFENLPEVKEYKKTHDKYMYFQLHGEARKMITNKNRVKNFTKDINNSADKFISKNVADDLLKIDYTNSNELSNFLVNGNFNKIEEDAIHSAISRYPDLKNFNKDTAENILRDYYIEAKKNQQMYNPDHETVLKKYDEKPKLYKKLTGQEPVPYTDPDGNTWMKVKIPEKIKKGQGEIRAFKQGGYVDKLRKFIG